jgi:hypothetical protein
VIKVTHQVIIEGAELDTEVYLAGNSERTKDRLRPCRYAGGGGVWIFDPDKPNTDGGWLFYRPSPS